MMLKKCLKEFAPDTSQGRLFLKVAGVLVAFAAGCHLIMGARIALVPMCAATSILSLLFIAQFVRLDYVGQGKNAKNTKLAEYHKIFQPTIVNLGRQKSGYDFIIGI